MDKLSFKHNKTLEEKYKAPADKYFEQKKMVS